MDERIKVYDEKMTKTFNNLLSEFATIRARTCESEYTQ